MDKYINLHWRDAQRESVVQQKSTFWQHFCLPVVSKCVTAQNAAEYRKVMMVLSLCKWQCKQLWNRLVGKIIYSLFQTILCIIYFVKQKKWMLMYYTQTFFLAFCQCRYDCVFGQEQHGDLINNNGLTYGTICTAVLRNCLVNHQPLTGPGLASDYILSLQNNCFVYWNNLYNLC